MKRKRVISCPELTLPKNERRKRYKRMARIKCGANLTTRRQEQRLPNSETPSAQRKARWMLRRMLKRQGLTMADIA